MASRSANPVDAAALADELARVRVVDPERLAALVAQFSGHSATALAEHLVLHGALTSFQASRALAGETGLLVLGPYRPTGIAGRGTFGPLLLASHTSKPGRFAVRVLPLRSLWKARQAKQLARALAVGTVHSAVVPLAEVDSANGFHYLVWPHLDGERLGDRVTASGPLAPPQVAEWLAHLAEALGPCHARNIVHGALTPQSVLLVPTGPPRVLELGAGALLAQNLDDDESLFDSMSTAATAAEVLTFAAPELAANPLVPTPACDQYALGAVGYFAVTGLRPYPHPALSEQLRAKRAGPPPSAAVVNPEVPPELGAIFDRMMAPDPADRFATLGEAQEQLAALATADSGESPPASIPLSSLANTRDSSGTISWSEANGGTLRPVARDDTDASVAFDLPEAAETLPNGLRPGPVPGLPVANYEAVETPPNVLGPPAIPAPAAERPVPKPPPLPRRERAPDPTDPRLSAPAPVAWHNTSDAPDAPPAGAPGGRAPDQPPSKSVLWKAVKRNLLFWKVSTDTIQVSIFGPGAVTPGQSVKLAVYLHTPDTAGNVRTLARAFQQDAELLGTGYVTYEVLRSSALGVHVSVANAGVAKSLVACQWRGQPHRVGFELHVPWESPDGTSPGLVSVGLENVRIGKIEFWLNVLPRRA